MYARVILKREHKEEEMTLLVKWVADFRVIEISACGGISVHLLHYFL